MNELNQLNQQLPGESDKAFHAFRSYLALGPKRSLSALARQLGQSKTSLEPWSKRWKWVERAQTHTQRIAQIQDVAAAEAIQDDAEKWARRGEQLKELEWNITLRLVERAAHILQSPEFDPSTRDACLAVELASKIGHLASDFAARQHEDVNAQKAIPFAETLYRIYGVSKPGLNPGQTSAVGPQRSETASPANPSAVVASDPATSKLVST